MKSRLLLSLLLLLCAAPQCFAQVHITLTWPEAVSQADVGCLGTIAKAEIETENRAVPPFSIATVHVHVVEVLKGATAQKQITIYDWHLSQVAIPTDKYVVFFLKSSVNGDGSLDYCLWDGWDNSLIALGNEPPLPLPSGLTSFRATGLLMAASLAHADHERRGELLNRLNDAAFLYRPAAPYWVGLARGVGEPNGISQFWEQQIVPLVKLYVHDSDKDMAHVARNIVEHRL